MTIQLKQSDEIWTQDGHLLGHPHRIYHRTKDINPILRLYADYVQVVSFEIGEDYYVPTDFIDGRYSDNGRITLAVPMKTVQKNTWNRLPDFVVHGEARRENLPGRLFEIKRADNHV